MFQYSYGICPNVVPAEENLPIPGRSRENVMSEEEKKVSNDGSSKTVPKLVIKLKGDPCSKKYIRMK